MDNRGTLQKATSWKGFIAVSNKSRHPFQLLLCLKQPTTIMCIDGTIRKGVAAIDLDNSTPKETRVMRAKRLLEESTERVEIARKKARRDLNRFNVMQCKENLDKAVLTLIQFEEDPPRHMTEEKDPTAFRRKQRQLQDHRQMCLMKLVDAEEVVLDESDEE